MQQRDLTFRRRLMAAAAVALGMILIHAYWLNAFLVYAAPATTAPYSFWPRIPLAADSPFVPFPSLGPLFDILMLSQLVNWLLLPWIAVWMCFRLRDSWRTLAWGERSVCVAVLLVTLPALATMWSPLGQAVFAWLAD